MYLSKISSFFSKDKRENIQLEFELEGHKFYSWKSLDQMPLFREMAIRLQYAKMGIGVHHSDLKKYCKLSHELLEKGEIGQHMSLTTFLDSMLSDYLSEKLIIELGGLAFLIDDEPTDDLSEKHQDLKRKLLSNSKLQFFFITKALKLLQQLSNELDTLKVREYINNPMRRKREQVFLRLIQSSISENLWMGLIPK